MTQKLIECVANFSEGRREEVIQQIVEAIAEVPGVQLLDQESDRDHNRSVITFAGDPDGVVEAAFQGIKTAAELIDLDQHIGEHPRLGATDVVPFVPIQGVTMDDCVKLAQKLGKRVGTELKIPVYLYEAAATRPDRENLANVRRGQYEALKESIATDPDRKPDFGPAEVGKAGATVIGARAPLVAFNVYLTTDDVGIAKAIAKVVRHSTGGLRFVKALGLLVDGKAQVSMNLTDTSKTSVYHVVEMIRREAARYGVGIRSTELVGLIPQQTLLDAAQWYLQLDDFEASQVLETRLAAAPQSEEAAPSFLDALASGDATPGGGSAAAYGAAMAASLVAMVGRVTVGKKKYADVETRMQEIITEADNLRVYLADGVQRDSAAFDAVMDAFRMPKDTEEQKTARAWAIEEATHHAAEVPLDMARRTLRVLELAVEVAEKGNVNAVSDAGSAGSLARASIHASGLNVKINATSVKNRGAAAMWLDALAECERKADDYSERLHGILQERGGIEV